MRRAHMVEGFVVSNIYLGRASNPDNSCSDVSLSSGVAVSYCKQQDDYWYKFHLKHGKLVVVLRFEWAFSLHGLCAHR
jgi:hypothetical protein